MRATFTRQAFTMTLTKAADAGSLAPALPVSARSALELPSVPAALPTPCANCARWNAPLSLPVRLVGGVPVVLTYAEWILWAWHVRTHRRLHVAARDFTESDS